MTEFRKRKDDGRVFPIQKRKPYGIPRQLAYKDVQAFRQEGKRARLIKTNKKIDLYAPYVSDIPDAPGTNTTHSVGPENEKKISVSREASEGQKIDLREQFALVNKNSKPNMNLAELKEYFSKDSKIKATIKDGKLTFMSIDPSSISMIMETMDTNLPDGFLHPVAYGKDFEMAWTGSPAPETNMKMSWPTLNFDSDSWTVRLEGNPLRKFMKDLRSIDGDAVRFNLIGGTKKASVQLARLEEQEGKWKKKVVPVDTMNAQSNRVEKTDAPEGWDTSEKVLMPREFLQRTITAMMGRKGSINPSDQILTLQLKPDYPLIASTRRIGPNGEHIEISGAVAPRMKE
ncbi:MAG: hypothetical protein ACYCSO_05150 [Cuniculiplasma sp.]